MAPSPSSASSPSSSSASFLRRLARPRGFGRSGPLVALAAAALAVGGFSAPAWADPAPVPCSAGGSVYYCNFYPAGDGYSGGAPVESSSGGLLGYLNQGQNYVYCQQQGGELSDGTYYNDWWAWTDANDGNSGWVSALYGQGGDNDGAFQGVPNCGGAHGNPPGGGGGGTACSSAPGAGTAVTRWNPVVACVLGLLGEPASSELINDVDIVIAGESSGDPNAINDWDINAQEGHPSEGLVQVIQPTFNTYHSSQLPNDIWDPAANIYAGMNYGINTYGSIQQIPGVASVNSGGPYRPYVVRAR